MLNFGQIGEERWPAQVRILQSIAFKLRFPSVLFPRFFRLSGSSFILDAYICDKDSLSLKSCTPQTYTLNHEQRN